MVVDELEIVCGQKKWVQRDDPTGTQVESFVNKVAIYALGKDGSKVALSAKLEWGVSVKTNNDWEPITMAQLVEAVHEAKGKVVDSNRTNQWMYPGGKLRIGKPLPLCQLEQQPKAREMGPPIHMVRILIV